MSWTSILKRHLQREIALTLLIIGVVLWSALHLFPALLPETRGRLIERLGNGRYRGLFALGIVMTLVLIVLGWRNTAVDTIYAPPL